MSAQERRRRYQLVHHDQILVRERLRRKNARVATKKTPAGRRALQAADHAKYIASRDKKGSTVLERARARANRARKLDPEGTRRRKREIHRARVNRVGPETLKLALRDPDYEIGKDFAICRICSAGLGRLERHLARCHHLTAEQYVRRFPGARTIADNLRRTLRRKAREQIATTCRRAVSRKDMSSVVGRPGPPLRPWVVLSELCSGKTVAQIAKHQRYKDPKTPMRVAWRMGMSSVACRYLLDQALTKQRAYKIFRATGLDPKEFGEFFHIPAQLAYKISAPLGADFHIHPAHATSILEVIESLVRGLAARKGDGGRLNLREVLRAIFPNLRQVHELLTKICSLSKQFFRDGRALGDREWQDWICDQARLENAGLLSGHVFTKFLPLAPEFSEFMKGKSELFRNKAQGWELAGDYLARRFGTTQFVVLRSFTVRPLSPRGMEILILRTAALSRTEERRAESSNTRGAGRKRDPVYGQAYIESKKYGLTPKQLALKYGKSPHTMEVGLSSFARSDEAKQIDKTFARGTL